MKPYKNQDPIRLVLADVDGTLVTQQKVLTAKTKEAVGKLRDAGIMFAERFVLNQTSSSRRVI